MNHFFVLIYPEDLHCWSNTYNLILEWPWDGIDLVLTLLIAYLSKSKCKWCPVSKNTRPNKFTRCDPDLNLMTLILKHDPDVVCIYDRTKLSFSVVILKLLSEQTHRQTHKQHEKITTRTSGR